MLTEHATGSMRRDDVELFYRRFGRPGGTPILIVHGLSYFSYDWIDVASRIAIDREVIAIDMRGFGNSSASPSKDYKLEALSADVVHLLKHFGWDKAILIGHSFGGRVCLATAGWTPQFVAGLVLVDFAPDIAAEGRRHTAERIGLQPDVFDSVDHAMSYHGHREVPADSPLRARYEAFLKKTGDGYALRRDLSFRDNFKKALDTGQSAPVPAFFWPMLRDLTIPVLVIRGSQSDMFAAETMSKVGATNPGATVIELEGGHDLAHDNPDGLVRAIRDYLNAHTSLDDDTKA